jgi:hypothetical protein
MLFSVLVVAFPVGVFSDLWSQELKEAKGFDDLFQDDVDENEIQVDGSAGIVPGRRQQYEDAHLTQNSLAGAHPELGAQISEGSTMYVVMEKEDLNEIVGALHSIRQSQKQIRNLLRKYYDEDNQQ